ncbi:helix-turn-helix transcriptional regulator [Salinibaculum salinum]|uniref:helix-turn-helix transcriptional regulator n=1 Tax=Salinibaculum salinum TaxID=3131996 RepID=UPI0030EC78E3
MDLRALHGTDFLTAVVFLASTLVLAVQLINPSPVVVSVGENGTEVAELGGYFRYRDVSIIAISSCLLGASGSFLLTSVSPDSRYAAKPPSGAQTAERADRDDGDDSLEPSDELLEARRQEWEETAERLVNNEQEIYEIILDADGVIAQSDIVEQTDLSKATVSRTLDSLETKNAVERKRRGMGNMVLLL